MRYTNMLRIICFVLVILVISAISVSAIGQNKNCSALQENPQSYDGGPWPKDVGPFYFAAGDKVRFRVGGYLQTVTIYAQEAATYIAIDAPVPGPNAEFFIYTIPFDGWHTFTVSPNAYDPGTNVQISCKITG